MSIPKFFEFFRVFLIVLQDGELHTSKDVKEVIAINMNLTAEDMVQLLPSGKQTTFDNRVAWARTYLDKAGLIETPIRGRYKITAEGLKVLASGDTIDIKYLERYDKFKKFHKPVEISATNIIETEKNESPMEILDSAFQKVNVSLASQLMDEVMKLSPYDFEKIVVKLLVNMGYGSGIDNAGFVTQASSDEGIDGIIKEDQLGFSSIYIQAKKWNVDQTVGRPEIQKFVGALSGQQAQKGLFITTAKFSSGARNYAKSLLGQKVVLVDGNVLTKLMIKHNVGVAVEQTYEVKKLDSDFFDGEL